MNTVGWLAATILGIFTATGAVLVHLLIKERDELRAQCRAERRLRVAAEAQREAHEVWGELMSEFASDFWNGRGDAVVTRYQVTVAKTPYADRTYHITHWWQAWKFARADRRSGYATRTERVR